MSCGYPYCGGNAPECRTCKQQPLTRGCEESAEITPAAWAELDTQQSMARRAKRAHLQACLRQYLADDIRDDSYARALMRECVEQLT